MEKLDLIDRKILSELDRNARISYSELGKKTRVAKETVKYRITQLEKRSVVKGYYTVLNFSKLGYQLYRLYLRLQNVSPKLEHEIIEYLTASPRVAVLYRINGAYHLAMGIWARSLWEYEAFWNAFKSRYGHYLSAVHLSLMSEYLEFTRSYLLPERKSAPLVFPTVSSTSPERLDETDLRLLEALSSNARAPLTTLVRSLRVSLVTVRYHLRRLLQKKVILGFRPILNLQALGREYYKVDLWLSRFGHSSQIRQKILSNPSVTYTERTLIAGDFEFDIEPASFESFIATMDGLQAEFPEDIREYTYYSLIKNYKTRYAPELSKPINLLVHD